MAEPTLREPHPAALLFPMMPLDQLQKLAADIQENGLREDIVLLDGQILDGRNRLRACEIAGVEPRYTEAALNGTSVTLYVASKNLHRRHLTLSQRAAIGAEMMPMLRDEAKKRMANGGKKHGTNHQKEGTAKTPYLPLPPEYNDLRGESRSIAAKAVKAGGKTIQSAAFVRAKNPEVFEQIKRGEISVSVAERIVKEKGRVATEKHALPHVGGKKRASWEKAETHRFVHGLSQIRGMCRGLAIVKLELVKLTDEERKSWVKTCFESAVALRRFAARVRQAS